MSNTVPPNRRKQAQTLAAHSSRRCRQAQTLAACSSKHNPALQAPYRVVRYQIAVRCQTAVRCRTAIRRQTAVRCQLAVRCCTMQSQEPVIPPVRRVKLPQYKCILLPQPGLQHHHITIMIAEVTAAYASSKVQQQLVHSCSIMDLLCQELHLIAAANSSSKAQQQIVLSRKCRGSKSHHQVVYSCNCLD